MRTTGASRGRPVRWKAARAGAVGLSLTLLLQAGCGSQQTTGEVVREGSVPSAGLNTVRLTTDNAAVAVETWDRPEVSVRVRIRASGTSSTEVQERLNGTRLVLRPEGGTLQVSVELPPNRVAAESYSVQVPAALALTLQTSNGAISVGGVRGALDLRTTNGAINVTDPAAVATLQTTNGSIAVRLAAGRGANLDLETTNGRVSVPALGAEGTRRINAPIAGGGPSITARAMNGSIQVTQGS